MGAPFRRIRLPRDSCVLTGFYSYLWPGYTDEASNYHVLLIALIANVKNREGLNTWSQYNVLNTERC
jgi:hypothetical protein